MYVLVLLLLRSDLKVLAQGHERKPSPPQQCAKCLNCEKESQRHLMNSRKPRLTGTAIFRMSLRSLLQYIDEELILRGNRVHQLSAQEELYSQQINGYVH
ncbi:hypothetical protein C0J52_19345 [Blattella germanica]|nr:hypothetical protein C0J52_19345 [Blattella germanica]